MDCQEAALALVAVTATRCPGNPGLLGIVVKGLINMILTNMCYGTHTQIQMENEIKNLVREGPSSIIVIILRSIMHSAAGVDSRQRDGFIMDILVLLAEKIHASASIAKQAMQNRYKTVLAIPTTRSDGFIVAADAARAARIESLEKAAPPWIGATVQQIEDITLMLCETLRAVCMGELTPESRHQIRLTLTQLCETEFIDSVYATCIKEYTSEMLVVPEPSTVEPTGRKSSVDDDVYAILRKLEEPAPVPVPVPAPVPVPVPAAAPASTPVAALAPRPQTFYGRLMSMDPKMLDPTQYIGVGLGVAKNKASHT